MSHARKIPEGRGICVVDAKGPGMRTCVDMCDMRIKVAEYTPGTAKGTQEKIEQARAGSAAEPHVCPQDHALLYTLVTIVVGAMVFYAIMVVWKKHGITKKVKAWGFRGIKRDSYPEALP